MCTKFKKSPPPFPEPRKKNAHIFIFKTNYLCVNKVLIKIRNICSVGNNVHPSFHAVLRMISYISNCVLVLEYFSVSLFSNNEKFSSNLEFFKNNILLIQFSLLSTSSNNVTYYKTDRLEKDSNF